ncbi:hypothetical protein D8B20_13730 [Candidatus Pantoea soli]|uniref:Uncharacterized protein n=1 Tax=Candidatus Pantoea soli TaxID=3098669 RepID=A0A518XF58_9GAMM|nr:hypothetical protein D8B20_13730 [Pantoea soli]
MCCSKKKAPQFAVLFKITMDRQGKSTGIKSLICKVQIKMQTQHHDHKPKAFQKSAISRTFPENFSFRLRKCGNYRYLLELPQRTNYNVSD